MPISTDLNVSPYFDDFDPTKDYYKILFQPGEAVQTRELNQLQTLLQAQIERFGDNIFKSGTIIDGCNITIHSAIPYIKLRDTSASGNPIDVTSYEGMFVKNSSNLTAYIVSSSIGYEASPPYLKTLYLKYINSGEDSTESTYTANQILTVYDPNSPIFSIDIANGSSGFSNSDIVVITAALEVQNSSGGSQFSNGFFSGDFITNGLGANLQITYVANNDANNSLVLGVSPKTSSLVSGNVAQYNMNVGDSIIDNTTLETASIIAKVGTGAAASFTTDSLGKVSNVYITSTGNGYYTLPTVRIQSTVANSAQLDSLSLLPINYLDKVTVSNSATTPVGTGYGITVGNGVIYQKGYFLRVSEQLSIVEKYGVPDQKVIGFATQEEIIDSYDDSSLLDNALGTRNETAPGANRLRLTPVVQVLDRVTADANSEFLSIMEFSEGRAYKQSTQTQYNIIENEIAKRSYETSGNFVLDNFLLNTKSPDDFTNESNNFSIVVDKGIAYINGFRVETIDKYSQDIPKAKDTTVVSSNISTNYGNYIRVQNFGGYFPFNSDQLFELRDTAGNYVSGSISLPGSVLGYARIRSIVCENQSTRTYKIYVFDIRMNPNANFKNIRSISYNGSNKGIADIILDGSNNAVVYDNNLAGLLFDSGLKALANISSVSYKYRSYDDTLVANSTGYISKVLSSNETFPYAGTLSTAEELDLIVIPQANITATSNLSGSVSVTTSSTLVTGSGTNFLNEILAGDFIKIANSSASITGKVQSVTNNISLTLSSNASSTMTGNLASYYPAFIPIDLQTSSRTANVTSNNQVLTINLGSGINSANVILVSDVLVSNASASAKTVNRNQYARIDTSNNAASNTGPWCLGISDIFRLDAVYLGSNNSFLPSDSGVQDITNEFYIDHNQNEDYLNSGYLVKKPTSTLNIGTTDHLLVKFDCFSGSDGITFINSYILNDTLPLANSSTTINTLEIPEVFGLKDTYYDLRDSIDFRPKSTNTATLTSDPSTATINPVEPSDNTRLSSSVKKYPVPYGAVSGIFTYFNGRKDMIVIDETGDIRVMKGSKNGQLPEQPINSLIIDELNIPAYPSLPNVLSNNEILIADTKIANEKYSNKRVANYTISSILTDSQKNNSQPKTYTMADIGKLENRISTLEYYVSFNLQESEIKNKSIVSATDNITERFKFGFFADSFDDQTYSDYNNPQFAAEFMNGRLVPPSDKINIKLGLSNQENLAGSAVLAPFTEYTLISQPYATEVANTTSVAVSNTSANTTSSAVVQSIVQQVISNRNTLLDVNGRVSEQSEIFMSSISGPVELYFNVMDNTSCIEIYQGPNSGFSISGKVPIYSTLNSLPLTSADRISKAYGLDSFYTLTSPVYMGSPSKPAVNGSGKILFNHDAGAGQYYKIVVTKYRKFNYRYPFNKGVFHYRIFYPVDSSIQVNNSTTPKNFGYIGIPTYYPWFFGSQFLWNWIPGSYYYNISASQKVHIEAAGLRPNTLHDVYLDGVQINNLVKPIGGVLGSNLISDNAGKVSLDLFYLMYNTLYTDYVYRNRILGSSPISRTFTISSADGSSTVSLVVNPMIYDTTINRK